MNLPSRTFFLTFLASSLSLLTTFSHGHTSEEQESSPQESPSSPSPASSSSSSPSSPSEKPWEEQLKDVDQQLRSLVIEVHDLRRKTINTELESQPFLKDNLERSEYLEKVEKVEEEKTRAVQLENKIRELLRQRQELLQNNMPSDDSF